jgi:hypothetical protein
MALSILRNPPRGSELAARVERMNSAGFEPGSPLADNPVLKEMEELYEVIREPRLWKLPAEWIVRHDLPHRVKFAFGEEGAAELERSPNLGLMIARQLQELDYLHSPAAKRAREPRSDLHTLILPIIYAEFLSVRAQMPEASANRHYEVTGINLGGSREPIDRNAIRRAVKKFPRILARLPKPQIDAVLLGISLLCDEFNPTRSAA